MLFYVLGGAFILGIMLYIGITMLLYGHDPAYQQMKKREENNHDD
jgi:hypothetical protein